jgi:energy-coupling factor transport system permease protein
MLFFIALMWPTMTSTEPISLFLILCGVIVIFVSAKLPLSQLKLFVVITLLSSPIYIFFGLFYTPITPNSIIITYLYPPTKFVPITLDAILYITQVLLKVLIVLTSFRMLPLTTPISDIVRGLSKFKIPPSITLAISGAFAYVPVMLNEAQVIQQAQLSRGLKGLEARNPVKRVKAILTLIVPMTSCSIRRSEQLAAAIESRGFGYKTSKRTFLRELNFKSADYAAIAMMLIFMIAVSYYGIWFLNILNYQNTLKILRDLFNL